MLIGFDQTLSRLAMPRVRNSWPRLIGSQPEATEIVSTEHSLSQRKKARSTKSKKHVCSHCRKVYQVHR
jgi:hypothetical protein